MKDLRNLSVKINFGQWSGQLPHSGRSYMVQDGTAELIVREANSGKKIVVGNSQFGPGEMISRVNSRYHGRCIRTIRAIDQ